ncbi:MAG: cell envelope integrity protein TolA [Cellvibrionaceae bacterium]|nr:cell envelope integrity protein TolA [Cellvibrionaceae bacterium]
MSSYWPAVVLSLTAHCILVIVVVWGWQFSSTPSKVQQPVFIKASLIELDAAAQSATPVPKKNVNKPSEKKPPPKKVDLTKKRIEQERKKKAAAEKARKQKIAKERAAKKAREKKLAAQKAAAEKRRAEARAREQQLLAQERQNLLDSLAKEREQLSAEKNKQIFAEQAREEEALKQSYSALIQQRIGDVWSRPPSARNEMKVILKIYLIPTGEVVDVAVTKSSGNSAFDRSAVQAVKKARQFPELNTMPSRLFEQQFRTLSLEFSPQDLRQ